LVLSRYCWQATDEDSSRGLLLLMMMCATWVGSITAAPARLTHRTQPLLLLLLLLLLQVKQPTAKTAGWRLLPSLLVHWQLQGGAAAADSAAGTTIAVGNGCAVLMLLLLLLLLLWVPAT
jgi:hypothetical protein